MLYLYIRLKADVIYAVYMANKNKLFLSDLILCIECYVQS